MILPDLFRTHLAAAHDTLSRMPQSTELGELRYLLEALEYDALGHSAHAEERQRRSAVRENEARIAEDGRASAILTAPPRR